MSELKDTAIKLFGKTIPLPSNEEIPVFSGDRGGAENQGHDCDLPSTTSKEEESKKGVEHDQTEEKDQLSGKAMETKDMDGTLPEILEEVTDQAISSGINENPKKPSADNETVTPKISKNEEEQNETGSSQEKTLKKPDKILPCPRCNSMDTKFCYYNNYNVNQPRHFCKNCQRYWTAGGTMRNVPVGAGRRKNKNSASHYRHLTVSETLQTARANIPDSIHHPALKHNGTVLTFGSETPLCESMASVLNLAEKATHSCTRNGFRRPEELRIPDSCGRGENGDQNLSRSSVTASNPMENGTRIGLQEPMMQNFHGFPPQIPCFPGTPWPYPWNSAQWSPSIPPHTFCPPPSFPVPFYQATPYWGCPVPGTWSFPWPSPPSSSNNGAQLSSPNSPTLGKHPREGDTLKPGILEKEDPVKQSNSERCLWIPKTLRIDDPDEAAKSSIWATLGIKNDKADTISGRGLFKAFQSKDDEKNHLSETSHVLQANPAALSRSIDFHESS